MKISTITQRKKTTFKVTYTKKVGGNGSILVIAENEKKAILQVCRYAHPQNVGSRGD